MALTYEKGTLTHMGEIKTGTSMKTGNTWQMQTIVLDIPEYQGQYRKLALKVSGREMDDVQAFKVGDQVEVGYKVTSREYNGNWYNDVSLYNIRAAGEQNAAPQQARPAAPQQWQGQAAPAPQQAGGRRSPRAQAAPAPVANSYGADELDPSKHDDLPW